MTGAIAQAFENAGYVSAADRVRAAAIEALASNPRNIQGAQTALLAALRKDAEALWELCARYRLPAADEALQNAKAQLQAQVQRDRPVLVGTAPKDGGGQGFADQQVLNARAPATRPTAARTTEGMAAAAKVAQLTLLDTFKINGQPIGNLTASEAVQWASSRERDARFVRLLTENLPPDRPIREFRTGEDAVALYAQAEATRNE